MTEMERKLLRFAACFLDLSADSYANHGCNDLEEEALQAADLTESERDELLKRMQEWNGDTSDPYPTKIEQLQDWMVMRFLASAIRKLMATEIERGEG